MIKKMERRFTTVAILVVSIVMLVLLLLVNVISISENIRRTDEALSRMAENNKDFQNHFEPPENQNFIDRLTKTFDGFEGRPLSKEDNRSFAVVIDKNNNLVSSNADERRIISDTEALQYAIEATQEKNANGFVEEYRYLKIEMEETTRVIFLDYSFERESELSFIWVSIGVYLASIVLVIILARLFMKPIMKPVKEAYAKQKQFITDASHELKTPLTVISTDIQIIEMENGQTKWTKSINNQVDKLKTLSNELVTLSRMDESDTHLLMMPVNFSDIVNDVTMGFEPAISAKNKVFHCDIEDDLMVNGNHDALEKVVSVLMHNALKYSTDQGTIWVSLKKDGKRTILKVKNTAENVKKGSHNEFFERFYRADQSRNSQTGGFGIGLAIAKSAIREHNGSIEAYSSDGEHLVVKVKL